MSEKKDMDVVLVSIDCLRNELFSKRLNMLPNFLTNSHLKHLECVTAAPYTTTSHASIFTGLYPNKHQLLHYFGRRLNLTNIFEILSSSNIYTTCSVDFPFLFDHKFGLTRSIKNFFRHNESDALADTIEKKQCTFSFFHFADVHWPYGFHLQHCPSRIPELKDFIQEKFNSIGMSSPDRLPYVPSESGSLGEIRNLEGAYNRLIGQFYKRKLYKDLTDWYEEGYDVFLEGRFTSFCQQLANWCSIRGNDYIIFIFGDHGEDWSETTYGHYNSCTQHVSEVPLFIASNRQLNFKHITSKTKTVDIFPTVLDFFGINIDEKSIDGQSLFSTRYIEQPAITQSWICDYQELVDRMQHSEATGALPKTEINSWLHCERVVSDIYSLDRYYERKGRGVRKEFSPITIPEEIKSTLSIILDDYNALIKDNSSRIMEDSMIEEFRNQGYLVRK